MRALVQVGLVLHHPHGVAQLDELAGYFRFGAGLRPFFDGRHETAQIELAVDALAQIARVGNQVFPPDMPPEGFPLFGAPGPGQHYIAVRRPQRQLRAEHIAPFPPGHPPGGLVERHRAGGVRHHAVVHRHIQILTPPGLAAAFQGQHNAQCRPHARHRVADVVAHHLRAGVGAAGDRHPAAHSLDAGIVGRPVGIGAGRRPLRVAVAGETGVNQSRVQFAEPAVAQPQTAQGARPPVVQQHIRGLRQPLESLPPQRVAQIEGNAFLVAVEAQIAGADPLSVRPLEERPVAAPALAHAGALDFDDFGAHIGQNHRAERAGHDVRYIQHPQALQRQRVGGRRRLAGRRWFARRGVGRRRVGR